MQWGTPLALLPASVIALVTYHILTQPGGPKEAMENDAMLLLILVLLLAILIGVAAL